MIKSLEIRNFRSFERASLENCSRVNIVVGDNGSGKTALLEGIFLAAGPTPEIALRTRVWRGHEGERLSGTTEEIERALWTDLFHKFNLGEAASVSLVGTQEHNRSLKIVYRDRRQALLAPNRKARRSGVKANAVIPAIEFRWLVPARNDVVIYPRIEDGKIIIPPVPESEVRSLFFSANRTYGSLETAQRFSHLSKHFLEKDFVALFARHFPNIRDLSIEISAGSPMIFASVKELPQKIPLPLASGGMNKLAALLLAPAAQPGSVILIDEIESGFYHRRLPMIWESLRDLAERYDAQIFASTHSAECLEAAAHVAESHPNDFAVIRPVLEKGQTKLRQFSGDKFVAAIEENLDVR